MFATDMTRKFGVAEELGFGGAGLLSVSLTARRDVMGSTAKIWPSMMWSVSAVVMRMLCVYLYERSSLSVAKTLLYWI
jgi:hypothetical protein